MTIVRGCPEASRSGPLTGLRSVAGDPDADLSAVAMGKARFPVVAHDRGVDDVHHHALCTVRTLRALVEHVADDDLVHDRVLRRNGPVG